MPGSFFDTSVILYLASDDPYKADRAEALVRDGGTIGVQVLNEMTNVARRKMRLSWPDTRMFLEMVRGLLDVRPMTVAIHAAGLNLSERFGFSTWDAMVVAAALDADSDTLWSEDMHDGLLVAGTLHIRNPFKPAT
jgi:predicted nucleic acid-binding protein